jgi:hypothetical protein
MERYKLEAIKATMTKNETSTATLDGFFAWYLRATKNSTVANNAAHATTKVWLADLLPPGNFKYSPLRATKLRIDGRRNIARRVKNDAKPTASL